MREPEVSTEVFFWRCLLSVTQPGKLWDGIKGIFVVESQGGDWNSSYKLTSTIFGIFGLRPPTKKNRLIPLDIKMNQHLHVESCQHETKTTKKHGF